MPVSPPAFAALHHLLRWPTPVHLGERNPLQGGIELRLPVWLKRCLALFDDQTGSGAVPV
jgi:hypothetical protein